MEYEARDLRSHTEPLESIIAVNDCAVVDGAATEDTAVIGSNDSQHVEGAATTSTVGDSSSSVPEFLVYRDVEDTKNVDGDSCSEEQVSAAAAEPCEIDEVEVGLPAEMEICLNGDVEATTSAQHSAASLFGYVDGVNHGQPMELDREDEVAATFFSAREALVIL